MIPLYIVCYLVVYVCMCVYMYILGLYNPRYTWAMLFGVLLGLV